MNEKQKNRKEITETKQKLNSTHILDRLNLSIQLLHLSKTFRSHYRKKEEKEKKEMPRSSRYAFSIFSIHSRPSATANKIKKSLNSFPGSGTVELFARFIRGYRDRSRLVFYKSASLLTTSCSPHALFIPFYPARRIFYFDQGHDSFQSCPRRRLFRF